MRKLSICIILFTLSNLFLYSQDFRLEIPNKNFIAEAGTGIDTKFNVVLNESSIPVFLSINTPQGIKAVLQPDKVVNSDSIVFSLFVYDISVAGQQVSLDLTATDNINTEVETINLQVIQGNSPYLDDYYAKTYRDSAIKFIMTQYPDIKNDYGDLLNYDWSGFYPYPPLDIVSHYVYLLDNWRMNVLWHVMVPPNDWKKVYIYNRMESFCWGINIDTDGKCTEIPCERLYYFYQDTNSITNIGAINYRSFNSSNIPNPFRYKTTISFPNPQNEPYTLRLYGSNGLLIKTYYNIRNDNYDIYRENLLPGIYFYHLEGRRVFHGKMIIL